MKVNINQTKFLNKDKDVSHKDILTINNEAIWEDSQRFKRDDGSPQSQFNIEFKLKNGDIRGTALNWTNTKLLVIAFGDDSKDWIGKEVRAWKTKSEKAKSGFSYTFVPIDWTKDEIGEWHDAKGKVIDVETKKDTHIEVAKEELDSIDIDDDVDEELIPDEDKPF